MSDIILFPQRLWVPKKNKQKIPKKHFRTSSPNHKPGFSVFLHSFLIRTINYSDKPLEQFIRVFVIKSLLIDVVLIDSHRITFVLVVSSNNPRSFLPHELFRNHFLEDSSLLNTHIILIKLRLSCTSPLSTVWFFDSYIIISWCDL